MDNNGVHIQIINSILNYAEKEWGKTAKATLLKISQIDIENLEGLQNYQPKELLFILLDTIKDNFRQESKIKEIGSFCSKNIIKESVYLHPILSEANPISFLKKSNSIFNIFLPDLNISVDQTNGNNFFLSIPSYKEYLLIPLITGFLNEIIKNFSKYGILKIKFKKTDKNKNTKIYSLKYQNLLRKTENLVSVLIFSFILLLIAGVLFYIKTPLLYISIMTFLSYFFLIYPFNIFINKKKAKYYQNLIKELNKHEKRLLSLDEEYSHEVNRLKTALNQLTELGNSILKEEDIEGIVEKIIYDALLLLGSERAILYFYDKDRHQFYGTDKYNKMNEIRFFADEGIVGKIGKLRKPIIVNDPYSNPFFSKNIDKMQNIITKNLIGSPIIDNQGELIGVMEVSNKIDNNIYTDIDLSILTSICNYGALAMQKYILMKKRIEEEHNRIMSKISNYFSTKSFINLIEDKNIPDFEGKINIINKLEYFLYIFSEKDIVNTEIPNYKVNYQTIHEDKNINLNNISNEINSINLDLIYQILIILIRNSKNAAEFRNIDFKAEISFTDEVNVPFELRKKYRLTTPINEWNNRTNNLADDFNDYLKKTYPLMDEDLNVIKNSTIYLPKIIYKDKCKGIIKENEEKIFYPFFSTYENQFGIGLNYLQKLIKKNKGYIYFSNRLNEGVEIIILFYKNYKISEFEENNFI